MLTYLDGLNPILYRITNPPSMRKLFTYRLNLNYRHKLKHDLLT